jgi:hypothetical protein
MSAIASTDIPPATNIRPRRLFGTRQRCLPPVFSREVRKVFRPDSFMKVSTGFAGFPRASAAEAINPMWSHQAS